MKSRHLCSLLLIAALLLPIVPTIVSAEVSGWGISYNNIDALSEIDTQQKHGGAASLRSSSQSAIKDDVYLMVRQYITVKPNTTYRYGFWAKGENVTRANVSISWGARTSLSAFGKNWDWKYFELEWSSGEATTAEFQFLMEGIITNLWIDDVTFYECDANGKVTGSNLVVNGDFEQGVTAPTAPSDSEEESALEQLRASFADETMVPVAEFDKTLGLSYTLPAVHNSNVAVDGDLAEWENSIAMTMPSKASQNLILVPENGTMDLNGEVSFMQDETYLYIGVRVQDDVHFALNSDMYWWADSIQFTVSCESETYGNEIGFIHTEDEGAKLFCSDLTADQLAKIQAATKREGTITTYEMALPWELTVIGKRPADHALISLLVNESDGVGRVGCIEMSPGISLVKNNADFFILQMLPEGQDYNMWLEGPRMEETGKELAYRLYFANRGPAKEFAYCLPGQTEQQTVQVPANTVFSVPFQHIFTDSGELTLAVSTLVDGIEKELQLPVQVIRSLEYFDSALRELEEKTLPELEALLKQCEAQGIPTDYEMVNYQTAVMFTEDYIRDHLSKGWNVQADFELRHVNELCDEAKEQLNQYLSGEATPKAAYKYVSSDLTLDGETIWADMRNTETGEISRRPMFGTGFGHFQQVQKDIPLFENFGMNTIQCDIGISDVIKAPSDASFWLDYVSLGGNETPIDSTYAYDQTVKKDGAASLRLTNKEAATPGRYSYKYQEYPVEPGKQYVCRFSAKAQNAAAAVFVGGWETDRMSMNGTFDWQEFTYEFTAKPGQTSMQFFIMNDGTTEAFWIDNISVCELGSDVNLIQNGDFEYGYDFPVVDGMKIDTTKIYELIALLEKAEEENVSINVQTAFHYFPDFIKAEDPDTITLPSELPHWYRGFASLNLGSPRVREVMEIYLRTLIPMIKDYKALNSICVANEPAYCSAIGDTYYPAYRAYLQERYPTIAELNEKYGTSYSSFEEVPFPDVLNTKGGTAHFYDWMLFNNDVQAEFYAFYTGIIREMAPDVPLHMKLMSYAFGAEQEYFRQWLVAGTDGEQYAELYDMNGCDVHGYWDSDQQTMLTKMSWYDLMTSMATKPIFDSEAHLMPDFKWDSAPQLEQWWAADLWEGAVHGRTMQAAWVWERSKVTNDDFFGGILMHPEIIAAYGQTSLDLNRCAFEIKALQDVQPQVGVLYSYAPWNYSEVYQNAKYSAWEASLMSGQKTAFVTEKQAAAGELGKFKLLIVPQCNQIAEETVVAIDQYLKNGGRVLIVGEESLRNDEHNIPFEGELVDSIYARSTVVPVENNNNTQLKPAGKAYRDLVMQELEQIGENRVRLVDAATGETAYQVEWLPAYLDGKLIVNVNYYGWQGEKELYLEVNGKKVETLSELRSNETYNGNFTAKPYEPLLLCVESGMYETGA